MMVGTGILLVAASTLQTQKAIHVPNDPPTSLKTSSHVKVQTERRRVARGAVNSSDTLAALKPMLERAKADSAITDAKKLLDSAEREIRSGKHEQAMLTLDGASMRLEQLGRYAETNASVKSVFQDLGARESSLRESLGQPSVPLLAPRRAKSTDTVVEPDADANATPSETPMPVIPKRVELPVG